MSLPAAQQHIMHRQQEWMPGHGLACSMRDICSKLKCTDYLTVAVLMQMGVLTGTIAYALTNKYHRMPSVGTCFEVCVAGFALQGGIGQIFRYHGTAADFIQSMDVVTVG